MSPIRVLIVDDETFARQRVRRLLAGETDVEIVGECASGQEAVAAIMEQVPDVVFLDVQMPRLDGFGVLREIQATRAPLVIFVTAFDEHALHAFDVHALDYLLKPVDPDRFRAALARARTQIGQQSAAERHARLVAFISQMDGVFRVNGGAPAELLRADAAASPPPGDRLLIKEEGRMFFLKAAEIDWIESYGNYARVHVGPRKHLIRDTMGNIEKRLGAAGFARIHRSTIVNLDRIQEMQPWLSGEYIVRLNNGTKLKLSRWYRDKLEARLKR